MHQAIVGNVFIKGVTGLVTMVALFACGSESSDGPVGLEHRIEVTNQAEWEVVPAENDPFNTPDAEGIRCIDDRDMMAEMEFSGFWYTVATRFCNYGTAKTKLKKAIPKGATIRARFFHFTITKDPGDWRIGMAIGSPPVVVFEKTYSVPSSTELFDEEFVAERDYAAGETVYWHIKNHGVNDWSLVTLTAIGPNATCQLSKETCAVNKPCEWYGQCAFDANLCECVVGEDSHCANSIFCSYYGLCISDGNACAARDSSQCGASKHCGLDGLCSEDKGECIAATNADCEKSDVCKFSGMCHAVGSGCSALSNADCQKSESCIHGGQCSEYFGACVALTQEDCAQSEECTEQNPCVIENTLCVPANGEARQR